MSGRGCRWSRTRASGRRCPGWIPGSFCHFDSLLLGVMARGSRPRTRRGRVFTANPGRFGFASAVGFLRVELVHGGGEALAQRRPRPRRAASRDQEGQLLLLVLGEAAQHVAGRRPAWPGGLPMPIRTRAKSRPRVPISERTPLWPPAAPRRPAAAGRRAGPARRRPPRCCSRGDLPEAGHPAHRLAADVHVLHRLAADDPLAAQRALRTPRRPAWSSGGPGAGAPGQLVDHHEAEVVAGPGVLAARVPEPDHQPHAVQRQPAQGGRLTCPSSRPWPARQRRPCRPPSCRRRQPAAAGAARALGRRSGSALGAERRPQPPRPSRRAARPPRPGRPSASSSARTPVAQLQVADVDRLADVQAADVDLDLQRDGGRLGGDGQLVHALVQVAAVDHADRGALEHAAARSPGPPRPGSTRRKSTWTIVPRQRIDLHVADHRGDVPRGCRRRLTASENTVLRRRSLSSERTSASGIQAERHRLLLAAVEHRRHLARGARAAGAALAGLLANLCIHFGEIHDVFLFFLGAVRACCVLR